MSGYCPDNYDQWAKLDREQYEREQRRPKCDYCNDPIHGHYYEIDGENVCPECLDEHFRKEKEYI